VGNLGAARGISVAKIARHSSAGCEAKTITPVSPHTGPRASTNRWQPSSSRTTVCGRCRARSRGTNSFVLNTQSSSHHPTPSSRASNQYLTLTFKGSPPICGVAYSASENGHAVTIAVFGLFRPGRVDITTPPDLIVSIQNGSGEVKQLLVGGQQLDREWRTAESHPVDRKWSCEAGGC